MFARAATMLAILAIAVVTTLTSAHAARLSVVPDHDVHVAEMMQASHAGEASCDGDQHCGPAGACELACAGLSSVFVPSTSIDAGHSCSPVNHDRLSDDLRASRAPGLNERPPKTRLL